jgi:hypothetical protein
LNFTLSKQAQRQIFPLRTEFEEDEIDYEPEKERKSSNSSLGNVSQKSDQIREGLLKKLLETSNDKAVIFRGVEKNPSAISKPSISRSSRYRGVSKNGHLWQVMMMKNQIKIYFGTIRSEYLAAQLYDRLCIQQQGLKARTNFRYAKKDVVRILSERAEDILDDDEISEPIEGEELPLTSHGALPRVPNF